MKLREWLEFLNTGGNFPRVDTKHAFRKSNLKNPHILSAIEKLYTFSNKKNSFEIMKDVKKFEETEENINSGIVEIWRKRVSGMYIETINKKLTVLCQHG